MRTSPSSVEIAPREMKTMLKPRMKAAELNVAFRQEIAVAGLQFLDARSRDQRNVAGNQRQNAGREEGNQAGNEGSER